MNGSLGGMVWLGRLWRVQLAAWTQTTCQQVCKRLKIEEESRHLDASADETRGPVPVPVSVPVTIPVSGNSLNNGGWHRQLEHFHFRPAIAKAKARSVFAL